MLKTVSIVGVVLGALKLCSISVVSGVSWGLIALLTLAPMAVYVVMLVVGFALAAKSMR